MKLKQFLFTKKHIAVLVLALLAALCALCALAGCSGTETRPYDYLVTFNYNTDGLGLTTEYADQYLGVSDGSLIMQPCKPDSEQYMSSNFRERQIDRYEADGWYTGTVGEDGTVTLGREWDFAADRVTEDMTLYANLVLKPTIRLIVDGEVVRENSYVVGRVVTQIAFNPINPRKDGYTFYGYYTDEAFTREFSFPYTVGEEDVTLYARFIEGENWHIVSTAEEFNDAFFTDSKIYLKSDIDFSDTAWNARLEFAGEINGNGHTISNIDCALNGTVSGAQVNMGLFGVLRGGSYIHDVTFENVRVTVNTVTAVPVSAALFAWRIDAGAVLERVTVSGSIARGSIYEGGDASLYGVCVGYPENMEGTQTDCDFSAIVIED